MITKENKLEIKHFIDQFNSQSHIAFTFEMHLSIRIPSVYISVLQTQTLQSLSSGWQPPERKFVPILGLFNRLSSDFQLLVELCEVVVELMKTRLIRMMERIMIPYFQLS